MDETFIIEIIQWTHIIYLEVFGYRRVQSAYSAARSRGSDIRNNYFFLTISARPADHQTLRQVALTSMDSPALCVSAELEGHVTAQGTTLDCLLPAACCDRAPTTDDVTRRCRRRNRPAEFLARAVAADSWV
jgi:hypothetical protein